MPNTARKISSSPTAYKPQHRRTALTYVERETAPNSVKKDLKVVVANPTAGKSTARFLTFAFAIFMLSFFASLAINVRTSYCTIHAVDLENQIAKVNQDAQEIRVQMEEKGTDIAQRAKDLGMVQREKTIIINLNKDELGEQKNGEKPSGENSE
jgi:hypothetical protein